jgi:hypothetical protein
MFNPVSLERRIPADQPPGPNRKMTDAVRRQLLRPFGGVHAETELPSIAPESASATAATLTRRHPPTLTAAGSMALGAARACHLLSSL